jgi:hypothetical protein
MEHSELFEKYNQQFYVPRGASLSYDGTVDNSSHFSITDKSGNIHKHEFDPMLDDEEIEYMLEMLAQQL